MVEIVGEVLILPDRLLGGLSTDNLPRVFISRTCIAPLKLAAIYCPHGNQIAQGRSPPPPVVAVHKSHEVGTPVTTLTTGEVCLPYSFQTIDDWGVSWSAEW